MKAEEYFKKTEECIFKFKNGRERYRQSPTFNVVVQMLVRGIDPYDVIDQLCQSMDDTQEAFKQYMARYTSMRPIFFHNKESE
jgi:hypothetical protein